MEVFIKDIKAAETYVGTVQENLYWKAIDVGSYLGEKLYHVGSSICTTTMRSLKDTSKGEVHWQDYLEHGMKLCQCIWEPDESYDALSRVYQHAARFVLSHCTTQGSTLRSTMFFTDNAYESCDIYVEIKDDLSKLEEAHGQVLDRAEKGRKGARVERKMFAKVAVPS
ncbi:hypothetical protein SELMODRAFT_419331 [Selaginella moellendorffii]|uniref:Uncharacterized protein n=1 Tax=Selaginella moellendorffii TaxID=88036 RepID=D8S8K6_SELML|nr:hypothetical protein SELMODRAFT_419331 [Selaginella moellendorffii]